MVYEDQKKANEFAKTCKLDHNEDLDWGEKLKPQHAE